MLSLAQKQFPNKRRVLYIDVQGHLNSEGGYDQDAFEIISHFVFHVLGPYFSEIHTPRLSTKNSKPQDNEVPDLVEIIPAQNQKQLKRDDQPIVRKTKPSRQSIQDYLGIDEQCFICWRTPVERAHAIPSALGGSNDIRNILLLCKQHHEAAPDVDDPEAFWDWVDWRIDQEGRYNRKGFSPGGDHFSSIKKELLGLYHWTKEDIDSLFSAELIDEYYKILHTRTTTHFGVKYKPSTEAWAYNQARLFINANK